MPIYAFQCADCGHDFDRLQKMSDPDPETCPSCGASAVKRQLTAPSFRLSGSGWYETDFKKDGDKKRNLAEGSDAGKSDAGKSDAGKPDASKADAAKPDTAKTDAPKADAPKSESKPAESKPAAPPPAAPGSTS